MRALGRVRSDPPHPREIATRVLDSVWARLLPGDAGLTFRVDPGRLDRDVLALSFDDGPSPNNTPPILDLLREHDARATFFVVGKRIEGHETLLHRIVADGHEVASHTFSHVHTVHLPRRDLRIDLERGCEAIERVLGSPPRLIRPPFGKDRRRTAQEGRRLGMRTVMWSLDSGDAMYVTREEIARRVVDGAERGAIVLFHDGGDLRPDTLWALEQALGGLRERGFAAVPVGDLLAEAAPD